MHSRIKFLIVRESDKKFRIYSFIPIRIIIFPPFTDRVIARTEITRMNFRQRIDTTRDYVALFEASLAAPETVRVPCARNPGSMVTGSARQIYRTVFNNPIDLMMQCVTPRPCNESTRDDKKVYLDDPERFVRP